MPPGSLVTGCVNGIIVRDIDLTTHRIDFEIEDNDYFEIAYDDTATDVPKEFQAILRTKTLIRALPEAVELKIYATVRFGMALSNNKLTAAKGCLQNCESKSLLKVKCTYIIKQIKLPKILSNGAT